MRFRWSQNRDVDRCVSRVEPEPRPQRERPDWLRIILMALGWLIVLVVVVFGACFVVALSFI
jgi:hypothetical protein